MSNPENKNFFATVGEKCKDLWGKFIGLFKKKEANEAPAVEKTTSDGLVLRELSAKEKIKRFLRAEQGWLFVLPAIILLCIFTFYPIINAFIGAFMEGYEPLNQLKNDQGYKIGFDNFKAVITGTNKEGIGMGGASFLQCLINTCILTFISVPLSTLLALLISVALNSIKAVQKAYQTILFLPYLTNSLAMGAVFLTFFQIVGSPKNPQIGVVNTIIEFFGGKRVSWIDGEAGWSTVIGSVTLPWSKYLVAIVYEVWSGLPFKILILFSALQSVNKQYYDAAKIDGASKSKILWKITTPLIMPMISYLIITGIMGGMKQYNAIVGIFGNDMGVNYSMGTMVGYIYQYLDLGLMGYAFAGSLLLFIIIMIITVINLQVSKKRVHY